MREIFRSIKNNEKFNKKNSGAIQPVFVRLGPNFQTSCDRFANKQTDGHTDKRLSFINIETTF